jgi:hypothetical protein
MPVLPAPPDPALAHLPGLSGVPREECVMAGTEAGRRLLSRLAG